MKTSSLWKRWTALALSLVLVLGMLPLSAEAGSVNPGSYLSSSAYYGNKSKCKMDAAMAYGYAQVLANMGRDVRAILADPAGDGMPILVTATAEYDSYANQYYAWDFGVWSWNGVSATRYDFDRDADTHCFGGWFGEFGTLGKDSVLVVDEGWSQQIGDAKGVLYYKIKDAKLSLVRHDMSYTAWIDGNYAYGACLPLVKTTETDRGIRASVSEMRRAGWRNTYDGLTLVKYDSKYLISDEEYNAYPGSVHPRGNANYRMASTQIAVGDGPESSALSGSWSTAASLRSSLLAYVEATGDFVDVSQSHYAYDPVVWAVKEGITNGTFATTFSPDKTCTQGQILTFLWRAVGEPKATIANPFTNSAVTSGQYYYNAMLWAYEQGIVTSKSLNPNAGCQRSDVALYLWRLAGSPAAVGATFSDVSSSAPYAQAVAWAVREGITNGTSATTFSPGATCTRGQIVTFLYRDMA